MSQVGTHPEHDDDGQEASLDAAGAALFRLGRLFGRRATRESLVDRAGRAIELSRILVAEAVAAGADAPGGEVTVGVVAGRLAIDPSTASRLVAEAIRDGYLARAVSSADARRLCLALTPAGQALVEGARRYQRAIFDQITGDWAAPERIEFAKLLVRFAEGVAERLDEGDAADGG